MADTWQIVGVEDDHCIATWKNVGISIWRRATTRSGLALSLRAYSDLIRLQPSGIGWFVIVERTAMPPDDEVRKLVLDAMAKMEGIRALAAVHEGQGFQVASHRAVSTSLSTPGKIQFPRRIFGTIEEAVQWLSTEMRTRRAAPVRRDELIECVAKIRETLLPSARSRARALPVTQDRRPEADANQGSTWWTDDGAEMRRNRS